jgi:hypothetical protein
VWPDGYIYIWWDLPKELIKVEFGNDKTDGRDSTCYQQSHPWHNESASGRKQVKQRDTVWCDARRDLFKSRLVFLCQKRYTRIRDWNRDSVRELTGCDGCVSPATVSIVVSDLLQGSNAFRVEAVLHSKQRGRRGWFYTPIIQDVWWETRGSTAQFQGVLDHHSQEIQLFSK